MVRERGKGTLSAGRERGWIVGADTQTEEKGSDGISHAGQSCGTATSVSRADNGGIRSGKGPKGAKGPKDQVWCANERMWVGGA